MSDTTLIISFQNGDRNAFKHFYDSFYKHLCLFATGITNDEIAEDIVQDSFVKLWERREKFETQDAIKAFFFLYLTTKNACINSYKHQQVIHKHQESIPDDIEHINISHRIIEAEVLYEIQTAINQLPEGYRKVIYLGYYKGMSNQENSRPFKSINQYRENPKSSGSKDSEKYT
ncbi:RNA polymerase sigma factor [Pedobacter sp. NJ-S-72]